MFFRKFNTNWTHLVFKLLATRRSTMYDKVWLLERISLCSAFGISRMLIGWFCKFFQNVQPLRLLSFIVPSPFPYIISGNLLRSSLGCYDVKKGEIKEGKIARENESAHMRDRFHFAILIWVFKQRGSIYKKPSNKVTVSVESGNWSKSLTGMVG